MTAKNLLRQARKTEFRYLVDANLVGWLWPADHAALVLRLQLDKPDWYDALRPHILPPEPIREFENLHPYIPEVDFSLLT